MLYMISVSGLTCLLLSVSNDSSLLRMILNSHFSSISLISNVEVITHDEENPEISIRKENGKKIVRVNMTKSKAENSTFYSDQSESVSINQKSSIVKSGNLYKPLEEY